MPTIRPAPTNRSSNAASNIGVGARLERDLHPGAWWIWSLGMATAASRTTNPLLLAVIVAVVAVVVSVRRGDAPWSKGFTAYLVLGLIIIGLRIVFRMLLDGRAVNTSCSASPSCPCPRWRGIRIGGGVARGDPRRALRRPPARNPPDLPRRRERARQPQAAPEVGAERAVRGRRRRDRCVDRRAAARRERATGHPGAPAPRRRGTPHPLVPSGRRADHDRRARPLPAPRGGDGLARVRPHRWCQPSVAPSHRCAGAQRPDRDLRGRLRGARRDHTASARPADAPRRRGARRWRARGERRPRPPHPVPAGPLATARTRRGRLGSRGRHRPLRGRIGGSREPQPVAAAAHLAQSAAARNRRGPARPAPGRRRAAARRRSETTVRRLRRPRRNTSGADPTGGSARQSTSTRRPGVPS